MLNYSVAELRYILFRLQNYNDKMKEMLIFTFYFMQ